MLFIVFFFLKLLICMNLSDLAFLYIYVYFQGYESSSYKRIRINFRGSSFFLSAHELAYWVSVDFHELPPGNSVSHLCHLNSCAFPDHLNYEHPSTNNKRKICAEQKQCIGHTPEPECIFM